MPIFCQTTGRLTILILASYFQFRSTSQTISSIRSLKAVILIVFFSDLISPSFNNGLHTGDVVAQLTRIGNGAFIDRQNHGHLVDITLKVNHQTLHFASKDEKPLR
ncbi:hypothetical protein Nepgr_002257 [Nepenthes gracilis]|uniref:Uncharacterized protein n=1 Tax=Nepenthes gracilis TaxID=150966 RepID=A0AAD3P6L7_NEPGR|nr:hypothetical protein Nepgr_002257 [Nepenthes gracilis]